jgi:hypothetical protein
MLQGNEVDIAIMGRPPKELATRAEPFAAHPHAFVAPIDHFRHQPCFARNRRTYKTLCRHRKNI